tara:strand:+ start:6197 stop:6577 length:381 start_codon:yes stop_codon:yes gene_type:complete
MWKNLKKFPPSLVRLLARRQVGSSKRAIQALTNQEIAVASGMPVKRVIEISMALAWDDISIKEAEGFCEACNFNPFASADRNRASAYLRAGAAFTYLKKHPHWETFFKPLIVHVQTAERNKLQHSE